MKKHSILLLLGLLFCGIMFPGNALAQENFIINQYDVTMNVQENHAYAVNENLTVTFSQQSHGIYRYIPYAGSFYREINGQPVETSYRARVSKINVANFDYDVSTENDNYLIKIGNSNSYVSGTQSYLISYIWDPGDDKISSMDDVYFNIIPQNSDTSIQNAHFKIVMPKAFDASQVEFITGGYGSTNTDGVSFTVNGNTIEGNLNQPLSNNQGVTLKINLPQGYFIGAFTGNEFDPLMYIIFALALIGAAVIWFFTGRDKKPVETIEFYPPQNFTPSQIGFVVDGTLDKAEVLSLLMYWADKGYMTIEQIDKKNFIFHKIKNLPADAFDFEQTLFNDIFDQKDSFSTTSVPESFYDTFIATKGQIKDYFDIPENQLFTHSSKAGLVVISILMALPLLAYVINGVYKIGMLTPLSDGLLFIGIVSCFAIVPTVFSANLITSAIRNRNGMARKKTIGRLILGLLLLLVSIAILILINSLMDYTSILPILLALFATGGIACFQIVATQRTETGRLWLGQVLGFKNFIEKAEKDRIIALVNENPQYFFNILPYAYVLGITDKWAKNFETINIPQPSWYYGATYGNNFTSLLFASSLMHSMDHIASTIIVPPHSGSGGFGGGVGSW